ncbi:MAG: integrase [Desulforhopalus sp.]|jgi:integrase
MPPKQKNKKKWPTYVTERNGTISYRPRIAKNKQHLINTKSDWLSPPMMLGKSTEPVAVIMQRYQEAINQIEETLNPARDQPGTMKWLYEQYEQSTEWKGLSVNSQKSYKERLDTLTRMSVETTDDSSACLGDVPLSILTRPIIARIHKRILKSYTDRGLKGINVANGQIRQLSAMISWGLDTIDEAEIGINVNPCLGIKKPSTPKPDRYIFDQDYSAQLEFACAQGFDWLPIFFELAYLLACRSIEVRNLELYDILGRGVVVRRRKGSKTNIILWSTRLRRAVEAAIQLREERIKNNPGSVQLSEQNYLLTSRNGHVSSDGLKSAMSRLKKSMKAAGLGHVYWTTHDLKRKGISDADSRDIAGHKSEAMKDLYDTKLHEYQPPK